MLFKPILNKHFIYKKRKSKAHMKLLTLATATLMSMMNGSQALMLKADTKQLALLQEGTMVKVKYSGSTSSNLAALLNAAVSTNNANVQTVSAILTNS